jgi:enoyl-CoA hydratase/carnithine racemase
MTAQPPNPPFEALTYEVTDHIATVVLNRPEVHNAINGQLRSELKRVWRRVKRDPDVHVVVLTGAGDRAFTTGADRERMRDGSETETFIDLESEDDDVMRRVPPGGVPGSPGFESDLEYSIAPKSCDCWKPVIVAVNGMACGGAFYILGEADIIIAADHATFFDPHTTFGMVSAYESMHMLQRMPIGEVIRMQLLGNRERLSAQRAHQVGLVSEVVPKEDLMSAARWVAEGIAELSPGAVQGTLRAIWAARDLPRKDALAMSPHFLAMANPNDWTSGQQTFKSGKKVPWRLR